MLAFCACQVAKTITNEELRGRPPPLAVMLLLPLENFVIKDLADMRG
jgi:hypothetical protein